MTQTPLYEFRFPDIGEGIRDGRVLEWKRAPGDRVSEGETLALVETDKVVAEIPSPKDGILRELVVEAGREIQVGQVLARIELAAERLLPPRLPPPRPPAAQPRLPGPLLRAGNPESWPPPWPGLWPPVWPSNWPTCRGAAPPAGCSRMTSCGRPTPVSLPPEQRLPPLIRPPLAPGLQPLSTLRKTPARNLERSWQIPAAVVHEQTVVDELVDLRRLLNAEAEAGNTPPLSFLPFFIKVTALSLKRYPLLNSFYHPERGAFETLGEINIGFALDSEDGLVVPVIRKADTLTLGELQGQINRRRDEAARRALDLVALRDGSFTVSNCGSIGGLHGRPLILPPQVAILGIGRIHEAPAVRDGAVVPARQLPLSLVFDHRLIDGAYAAGFLRLLMSLLSAPHRLIAFMR